MRNIQEVLKYEKRIEKRGRRTTASLQGAFVPAEAKYVIVIIDGHNDYCRALSIRNLNDDLEACKLDPSTWAPLVKEIQVGEWKTFIAPELGAKGKVKVSRFAR